jgi:hypothetical protein
MLSDPPERCHPVDGVYTAPTCPAVCRRRGAPGRSPRGALDRSGPFAPWPTVTPCIVPFSLRVVSSVSGGVVTGRVVPNHLTAIAHLTGTPYLTLRAECRFHRVAFPHYATDAS